MAAPELVIRIEPSEPRNVWCDGCMTSGRVEFDLIAFMQSGLCVLGTFTGCDRCNPAGCEWVCRWCRGRFPYDGIVIHAHLRDRHGAQP